MSLLWVIFVICICAAFKHPISHPIISFVLRPNAKQKILKQKIAELTKQLETISMTDEYTRYVLLEREIRAAEKVLASSPGLSLVQKLVITNGVPYGLQALLSLVLIVISIAYRYVPVTEFGDRFNFAPFAGVMSFPTGVDGAISVPFWIFISTFVANGLSAAVGV